MPTGISPLTVTSQAYTGAGGDTLTFTIPNDFNVAAFGLRVNGNIVVGTANGTGVHAGGSSNFFKRVRILAKGEQRLDVLGKELRLLNLINNQSSVPQTDPGITVATQAFDSTLTRQFQMPRMLIPWNDQGILPANIIRDVQVIVDIGTPSDIINPAGTTTLAYSAVTVEFYVLQAIPTPAQPGFYVNEQVFSGTRDTTALTATGDKTFQVNTGGLYRHLLVYAESTASGLISYADTLLSQIVLKSNRTEILRQATQSLRSDNQQNFLLTTRLAGVYALDWTRTFSPVELLDADKILREGSQLLLTATVAASAATSTFGIVGARIFGNLGNQ